MQTIDTAVPQDLQETIKAIKPSYCLKRAADTVPRHTVYIIINKFDVGDRMGRDTDGSLLPLRVCARFGDTVAAHK